MFRSKCLNDGFTFKEGSNLSHVLMDGGLNSRLSVPFDRLNHFYSIYIECVKAGERVCLVEQKTDTFNFFVDLDYKDVEDIPFERLEEYTRTICDRVTHFGGKDVLISVAEPKSCGEGMIKYGIHMNWPKFVVDHGSAMALHSHIVSSLNIMFPGKPWKDIVDTAVYGGGRRTSKGSGFRMPWAHKYVKREYHGVYKPVLMYTHGNGGLTRIHDKGPSVDIMHMSTLRTQVTDHVIIEGSKREEGGFSLREIKNVYSDEKIIFQIESFIQKNLEGQGNSKITKVFQDKNTFLVGTNSRYCENLRREHMSNHVWFRIEGRTIAQRCFCTCPTMRGRRFGYCKDFYGRKHELPDKIFNEIYRGGYKPPFVETPNNICIPCPEVKKEDPIESVNLLKGFMIKHIIPSGTDIVIKSVAKKSKYKTIVNTDYKCNTCNKTSTSFNIVKNRIGQDCLCKKREHILTDKILRVL